jgi:hypothetical protein
MTTGKKMTNWGFVIMAIGIVGAGAGSNLCLGLLIVGFGVCVLGRMAS